MYAHSCLGTHIFNNSLQNLLGAPKQFTMGWACMGPGVAMSVMSRQLLGDNHTLKVVTAPVLPKSLGVCACVCVCVCVFLTYCACDEV